MCIGFEPGLASTTALVPFFRIGTKPEASKQNHTHSSCMQSCNCGLRSEVKLFLCLHIRSPLFSVLISYNSQSHHMSQTSRAQPACWVDSRAAKCPGQEAQKHAMCLLPAEKKELDRKDRLQNRRRGLWNPRETGTPEVASVCFVLPNQGSTCMILADRHTAVESPGREP